MVNNPTAEEFFKQRYSNRIQDKYDEKIHYFDYWDMIEFAEQFLLAQYDKTTLLDSNVKQRSDKRDTTTICIDFDGTCVKHEYPNIGEDIGAVPVLKELTDNGSKLILFTMRSGKELDDAVNWFKENNIPLYGIQKNPQQHKWTTSPKAFGKLYIDDAALGCPLIHGEFRPYVDWIKVRENLVELNLL